MSDERTAQQAAGDKYREALANYMNGLQHALLAASDIAPHPVWWKRLLRRPYRKTDPARFMAELHKLRQRL